MKSYIKNNYLIILILFIGMNSINAQNAEIPFTKAKNYYLKNSVPDNGLELIRFQNQEKFDSIFGKATLMGKEGKPTKIDFSKQYAVALLYGESNTLKDFQINSITSDGNTIFIDYLFQTTEPQTYSSRYFDLVILDKKYDGHLYANYDNVSSNEPMVVGDIDEFGCKASAGAIWSALRKECLYPGSYNPIIMEGEVSNYAVIFSDDNKKVELLGFKYKKHPQNVILMKSDKDQIWSNGNLKIEILDNKYVLKDKSKVISQSNSSLSINEKSDNWEGEYDMILFDGQKEGTLKIEELKNDSDGYTHLVILEEDTPKKAKLVNHKLVSEYTEGPSKEGVTTKVYQEITKENNKLKLNIELSYVANAHFTLQKIK